MAKEAKKNDLILGSSGIVNADSSNNFASVSSMSGKKGVNQNSYMCGRHLFCGIFDGHGPWGHFVAKRVRESMPSSLLCNWQETLAPNNIDPDIELGSDKMLDGFDIWKQSCLKTYIAIHQELEQHPGIDSFYSGTTALTIVRQVRLQGCNNWIAGKRTSPAETSVKLITRSAINLAPTIVAGS